jgi:hypothetical protein
MKNLLIFLLLLPVLGQCRPAVDDPPTGTFGKLPAHPRLLLLGGEEKAILQTVNQDATWRSVHGAILTESDALLATAPVERVLIGRRLLDKSRECLRRVFFLSYAWRTTQQEKYRARAEKELLAAAAFSDWNPSHFLDVAEMTLGVALGYDWLHANLSETSRATIREAILKKGLEPSLDAKYNGWLKSSNNWNQVCNAGMTFGALAIYEDQPELAQRLIDRAIETVVRPMNDFAPDGAYPEGYNYWGYGTSFNVLLTSALEKALGSDFGLNAQPGFLKTAGYLEHMTGPTNLPFNYADAGTNGDLQPAMFWFAQKQADPSLLWVERSRLLNNGVNRHLKNRLLPALLLWNGGVGLTNLAAPKATFWQGGGKNPVALMRSSWTDPAAVFVGFKGGSPSVSHAHMDVGSFVMEADGVRWGMDFGMQDYESLESKGVDLWNMSQNSQRWQIFRYNNYVHNTLTVNDALQRVEGYAPMTGYSATPAFQNAVADLSTVYRGALTKASRGVALVNGAYVLVRDELETLPQEATVRWTMLTPASVKITGPNTAELTKDGKKLLLQVKEPANVTMKTWTNEPPNAYDVPNPGTMRVGFEVKIPANTNAAFSVLLIPERAVGTTPAPIEPLAKWPR